MTSHLIGTIRLTGENALHFANSLFHPTKEESEHHNAIIDRIDGNIVINREEDGFTVEIGNLDLSFLDKVETSNHIETSDIVSLEYIENMETFMPIIDNNENISSTFSEIIPQYANVNKGDYLPCAA